MEVQEEEGQLDEEDDGAVEGDDDEFLDEAFVREVADCGVPEVFRSAWLADHGDDDAGVAYNGCLRWASVINVT